MQIASLIIITSQTIQDFLQAFGKHFTFPPTFLFQTTHAEQTSVFIKFLIWQAADWKLAGRRRWEMAGEMRKEPVVGVYRAAVPGTLRRFLPTPSILRSTWQTASWKGQLSGGEVRGLANELWPISDGSLHSANGKETLWPLRGFCLATWN